MHYVLGEIPPDQAQPPTTTTQLGIPSTIEAASATVPVASASPSVVPDVSNTVESLANTSKGSVSDPCSTTAVKVHSR